MKLKINEQGKKYLRIAKTLLIFLALAIPLIIIHEYIHYFAIILQGFKATINWNVLLPFVKYVSLEGITQSQLFRTAIAPYVFDLLLLIGFYIYRKNKTIRILAWVPFLDIAWNFLMFFIALATNKPNDFITMFITGNGIFAIALVVVADALWWKTIRWEIV